MSELQVDIQRCYCCELPELVVLTLAKCDAEIERLTRQWEVAEVGKVYAEIERLRAALRGAVAPAPSGEYSMGPTETFDGEQIHGNLTGKP